MKVGKAVDHFLDYVEAEQSHGTARTYSTGVYHFQRYLAEEEKLWSANIEDLKPRDMIDFIPWIYDYLLWEVALGNPELVRESTKATYLTAVSRFFEYLVIDTWILHLDSQEYDQVMAAFNRAKKHHRRDQVPPDRLPTKEIIQAMLDQVHKPLALPEDTPPGEVRRQTLAHLRNLAAVLTLLGSGMRVGELVRLRRGDLLWDQELVIVRYAKGGKRDRKVMVSPEAWEAIRQYLRERQDPVKGIRTLPVLARHDRRAGDNILPIGTRSIQNAFAQIAEDARIAERFHLTPHTLRHWFGSEFLHATGRLDITQFAMGHASSDTTQLYAKTKQEDYEQAYQRFAYPEDEE